MVAALARAWRRRCSGSSPLASWFDHDLSLAVRQLGVARLASGDGSVRAVRSGRGMAKGLVERGVELAQIKDAVGIASSGEGACS